MAKSCPRNQEKYPSERKGIFLGSGGRGLVLRLFAKGKNSRWFVERSETLEKLAFARVSKRKSELASDNPAPKILREQDSNLQLFLLKQTLQHAHRYTYPLVWKS